MRALLPQTVAVPTDTYADLVLSMRPFAYYRMEQPKNGKDQNVVFDSAAGAHHGTLHLANEYGGDPWWAGRFGNSISLREEFGDYINVPNFPATDGHQLSFSAWVYALGIGQKEFSMIACQNNAAWQPLSIRALSVGTQGHFAGSGRPARWNSGRRARE